MIRSLTGTIQHLEDNKLVIDVRGVGYLVASPVLKQSLSKGQTVTLHTYLAVRETALDLYGFVDIDELTTFELLLGIPKVGPKSALQIISQASPSLLVEATEKNDPVYLHKLSGIGKKTCENIIQYLANKIQDLPTSTSIPAKVLSQAQADAIDALISLGYDSSTARDTILALPNKDATVNSLVTTALKQIQ